MYPKYAKSKEENIVGGDHRHMDAIFRRKRSVHKLLYQNIYNYSKNM